jgi:transposase
MDVIYPRCGGLDVHKKLIVACVLLSEADGPPRKLLRTFGTMLDQLEELAAWLAAHGVTHVALESTGVYWKPAWNVLEGRVGLLLVNAAHIKAVPGRKTDAKDAEWLAELLRHGLLRGSFVPDRWQRELREVVRYRTALIRERAAEVNRLQKTLEGGNIKLAAVASNVVGASGRAMLAALLAGERDPAVLAELAQKRLRAKLPELRRALVGRLGPHQAFMIAEQLAHVDALDEAVARASAEVAERLRPYERELAWLDSIPGIGRTMAEILLAELGLDPGRFPSARHLASWAGMCPGQDESAGKRRGGRTRKGNPWLRAALIEAAHAAGRTQGTYLQAQYRRLAARRGAKRAAVAVGHSILVIAYHLLTRQEAYQDLGPRYFDERDRQHVERRLVRRLEELGYEVSLEPKEPAA